MNMKNVKVLGGGCSKCETLLANTKEAVKKTGIEAEIEYITDFNIQFTNCTLPSNINLIGDKFKSNSNINIMIHPFFSKVFKITIKTN